jgi:hypothetical protein
MELQKKISELQNVNATLKAKNQVYQNTTTTTTPASVTTPNTGA